VLPSVMNITRGIAAQVCSGVRVSLSTPVDAIVHGVEEVVVTYDKVLIIVAHGRDFPIRIHLCEVVQVQ
jgi:hypothetical protein